MNIQSEPISEPEPLAVPAPHIAPTVAAEVASGESTDYEAEFLNALPADIRAEVLRSRPVPTQSVTVADDAYLSE